MKVRAWQAAAGVLVLALLAGCGVTSDKTTFTAGTPTDLRITPGNLNLSVGGTQALAATAFDNRGLVVPDATVTWSAFNIAVATVDPDGTVHAVAPGVTSVSAIHKGLIARVDVTVSAGPVELSFDRDIKTTAALGCTCHQPGGSMASTGSMADRDNILAKGYVVPGNPQGSRFLTKGAGGEGHPNIWGANQQRVSDWIEQGAKP